MVPFLAPLLGSMAASLLPATVGTGIAGALGLSGAGAGLLAAAAPKALGAGLGTLLAGGDLGDAAMNAVGFGAGSTALGAMMGGAPGAAGAATSAAGTTGAGAAAPAAASPQLDLGNISKMLQGLGGGEQSSAMPAAPAMQRNTGTQASANPMLTAGTQPQPAVAQMASTNIPSVGGSNTMMPASMGIGSLPVGGQTMSDNTMLAGFAPEQQDMVRGYLNSQGMRFG